MARTLAILISTAFLATGSAEEDRAAAVRLAQAALAQALRVTAEHLRVADVRPVEWPDAALGCPEKGMQYAQVLVPGYDVRVDVDGTLHSVHVGAGRAVLCDRQTAPDTPKYLQVVTRVQDLARRDLAARLKVEIKDVRVIRLRPVTWPDTSLGCPEPDQRYDKVETKGFLIELEHADRTYVYHGDRQRVVFCPR